MWTYDPAIINTTTPEGRKNSVRLLIGDTIATDPQVQDEEIYFSLSESSDNIYSAAAFSAFNIYSKYARMVNTELDEAIRADYSDLADNYRYLFSSLRDRSNLTKANAKILATGITWSDVIAGYEDTERITPEIRRGRFSNYESDGEYVSRHRY